MQHSFLVLVGCIISFHSLSVQRRMEKATASPSRDLLLCRFQTSPRQINAMTHLNTADLFHIGLFGAVFHVPLRTLCFSVQECGRAAAEQHRPRVAGRRTARERLGCPLLCAAGTDLPTPIRPFDNSADLVPNQRQTSPPSTRSPSGMFGSHHKPLFVIPTRATWLPR